MTQPESWPRKVNDELMDLLIAFDAHAESDGVYCERERAMRERILTTAEYVNDVGEAQTRYLYVMRTGQLPTQWHARKQRELKRRTAE